jgi:hypothetical protein
MSKLAMSELVKFLSLLNGFGAIAQIIFPAGFASREVSIRILLFG